MDIRVSIDDDDGAVTFLDMDGNPLPDPILRSIKRQSADAIRAALQEHCQAINHKLEILQRTHLETPDPFGRPKFLAGDFEEPPPKAPAPERMNLLAWLFKSQRAKFEERKRLAAEAFARQMSEWRRALDKFEAAQLRRKQLIEQDIYSDPSAMAEFLEERLSKIEWPRETLVSSQIEQDGKTVFLDVDLPEVEDLPVRSATVPQRALKLTIKKLTDTNLRKLYMTHIHAVAFRLVGETFWALPNSREVVVSGFSQRLDPTTGHIRDDYLFSVCVGREGWSAMNFDNLAAVDPAAVFERFDLRRNMTKTGIFKPVTPFEPSAS